MVKLHYSGSESTFTFQDSLSITTTIAAKICSTQVIAANILFEVWTQKIPQAYIQYSLCKTKFILAVERSLEITSGDARSAWLASCLVHISAKIHCETEYS